MPIDFSTPLGERALHQLKTEYVIWITTTSPSGNPLPNVVWFLYEDGDVIMYAQPGSVRVRNLKSNPRVALNFDSADEGEEVTIFSGIAEIDPTIPPVADNPAYVEKYRKGLQRIDSTPEQMSRDFSVGIRVKLHKLRGQ